MTATDKATPAANDHVPAGEDSDCSNVPDWPRATTIDQQVRATTVVAIATTTLLGNPARVANLTTTVVKSRQSCRQSPKIRMRTSWYGPYWSRKVFDIGMEAPCLASGTYKRVRRSAELDK